MSVMSFLEKLGSKAKERQVSRATTWKQLVARVADGLEREPAKTLEAIDQHGRNAEDMAAAVQKLLARRAARKRFEAGLNLEPELASLAQAGDAARAKHRDAIEAAEAALEAALVPLNNRRREIERLQRDSGVAKGELESGNEADEIRNKIAELHDRWTKARQEMSELAANAKKTTDEADHHLARANSFRRDATHFSQNPSVGMENFHAAEAARNRAEAAPFQAKLADATKEAADLETRMAELRGRLLEV